MNNLIYNYNKELPSILHFQGKSEIMQNGFSNFAEKWKNIRFKGFSKDITVITIATDESLSPLLQQLKYNNVKYINAYKPEYGPFVMTDKIKYILNALNEVKTKYSLILDGYDVLIENTENMLRNFLSYNTRMLFNASKNNYPTTVIDKLPWRDYIGEYNHFNAGCAIGYTEDFKNFYQECLDITKTENFVNPFGSEQFILRHIFKQYCHMMMTVSPYITFDYKCKVFIALGKSFLIPTPENNFIAV